MNEELRDKVRKGIAFLDKEIPDWLDKAGDLETLDMHSVKKCILSRVTGLGYSVALTKLELPCQRSRDLGFSGITGIDERALTPIWVDEIRQRLHQSGEKPEYPWTWKGYPARIVEENIRGVIGDRVLILYLAKDVEIPVIVPRLTLRYNYGIKLRIGTKFLYDGFPRMVVAMPGMKALLIQPDTGGYIDEAPTASFRDAVFDTFTPEDFGLNSEKVEMER